MNDKKKSLLQISKSIFVLVFLLDVGLVHAQVNDSTELRPNWQFGNLNMGGSPVYGNKGVFAVNNSPGSRIGASSWNDSEGNYYLFGGYTGGDSTQVRNDLWQWNGEQWAWLAGSNLARGSGNYNWQAVGTPSARSHSCAWVKDTNQFFLFGGEGVDRFGNDGVLNDVWVWNGVNWTWLDGNSREAISHVASGSILAGIPHRSRASVWVSNSNVYIFGGSVPASASPSGTKIWYNDLHKITHIASVLLVDSTFGGNSVFSNNGTAQPGGRQEANVWVEDGNLIMLGGYGKDLNNDIGYLSDLWEFDVQAGTWSSSNNASSIKGSAVSNPSLSAPNFGTTQMTYSFGTIPALKGAAISSGSDGRVLIYGGYGWGTKPNGINDSLGVLSSAWVYKGPFHNATFTLLSDPLDYFMDGNSSGLGYSSGDVLPKRYGACVFKGVGDDLYVYGGGSFFDAGSSLWTSYSDLVKLEYGYFLDESNNNAIWSPSSPPEFEANISGGRRYDVFINTNVSRSPNTFLSFSANNLIIRDGLNFSLIKAGEMTYDKISVAGNLYFEGNGSTLSGEGLLNLIGINANHSIEGLNNMEFNGVIKLQDDGSFTTNDKLKLTATSDTAFGQILFESSSSSVIGNVTMETWMDLDSTNPTNNGRYFHMTCPLNGVNVDDMKESGAYMSGGNSNSNLNTVWKYRGDNALWESPNPVALSFFNTPLAIYVGANSNGNFVKANSHPGPLSFEGTLSPVRDSLWQDIYYHTGTNSTTIFANSTAPLARSSWNLIYNPFPSFYDLDLALPDGAKYISQTFYILKGSSYSTYNSLTGISSGNFGLSNRFVKPFQSFFIQLGFIIPVFSDGVYYSDFLNILEENMSFSLGTAAGFRIGSGNGKKDEVLESIELTLKDKDGQMENDAWLGFSSDATADFDAAYDAWKIPDHPEKGSLYTRTSNNSLVVNFLSKDEAFQRVPIHVDFDGADGENLFLGINLNDLSCYPEVWLEDKLKLEFIRIRNVLSYSFLHDSEMGTDRFVLHFTKNHPINLNEDSKDLGFYTYTDQGGEVHLVFSKTQNPGGKVRVYEASGKLVLEQSLSEKNHHTLGVFPRSGLYIIQVQDLDGYYTEKFIY